MINRMNLNKIEGDSEMKKKLSWILCVAFVLGVQILNVEAGFKEKPGSAQQGPNPPPVFPLHQGTEIPAAAGATQNQTSETTEETQDVEMTLGDPNDSVSTEQVLNEVPAAAQDHVAGTQDVDMVFEPAAPAVPVPAPAAVAPIQITPVPHVDGVIVGGILIRTYQPLLQPIWGLFDRVPEQVTERHNQATKVYETLNSLYCLAIHENYLSEENKNEAAQAVFDFSQTDLIQESQTRLQQLRQTFLGSEAITLDPIEALKKLRDDFAQAELGVERPQHREFQLYARVRLLFANAVYHNHAQVPLLLGRANAFVDNFRNRLNPSQRVALRNPRVQAWLFLASLTAASLIDKKCYCAGTTCQSLVHCGTVTSNFGVPAEAINALTNRMLECTYGTSDLDAIASIRVSLKKQKL